MQGDNQIRVFRPLRKMKIILMRKIIISIKLKNLKSLAIKFIRIELSSNLTWLRPLEISLIPKLKVSKMK